MNIHFGLPQAIFHRRGEEYTQLAASGDFPEIGADEFLKTFGTGTQVGDDLPLFALPFDGDFIGVGQFQPASELFRIILVSWTLWDHLPDPFLFADRFPPQWDRRGELIGIEWPATEGPKRRLVAELQTILKEGNGPLLLGATQGLVDTEYLLIKADSPQEKLARDIWMLLPDSTRRRTYLATLCHTAEPVFHLSFTPTPPDPLPPGFLDEERILNYTESRYEKHLQIAIEAGDQNEIDRLFSRRSTSETIRLLVFIILVMAGVSVAARFLIFPPQ